MNLREYLFFEKLSVTNFAKKIGISRTHLTAVISKKTRPSLHLSKLIEIETKGKVTLDELREGFNEY